MKSYDESFYLSSSGGYGSVSFYPNPFKIYQNWSTAIGGVYQNKFMWITAEVGYDHVKYNHQFYRVSRSGDPHWQPGSGGSMEYQVDSIKGNGNRTAFAIGYGIPLFIKCKKFRLIPRIKFTYSMNSRDKFDENLLSIKRYNHSYEHPDYKLVEDTIIYPSRYLVNKNNYDLTIGLLFKAGPFYKHWSFGLDVSYALKSNYILMVPTYKYADKLLFRNALTLSYGF